MKKADKSYWQSACVDTDRDRDAVKSWFVPMCDGMTPYKAEILCDIKTDREKKARAFMTNSEGKRYQFERTLGGKTFTISMKAIGPAHPAPAAQGE